MVAGPSVLWCAIGAPMQLKMDLTRDLVVGLAFGRDGSNTRKSSR